LHGCLYHNSSPSLSSTWAHLYHYFTINYISLSLKGSHIPQPPSTKPHTPPPGQAPTPTYSVKTQKQKYEVVCMAVEQMHSSFTHTAFSNSKDYPHQACQSPKGKKEKKHTY